MCCVLTMDFVPDIKYHVTLVSRILEIIIDILVINIK